MNNKDKDTILKSDNTFLRKPFSLCFLLTISSPLDWQETSHILFKLFPNIFGEYAPWVTILIDINTAISLLPSQKGFVSAKWRNLLTLQSSFANKPLFLRDTLIAKMRKLKEISYSRKHGYCFVDIVTFIFVHDANTNYLIFVHKGNFSASLPFFICT